jgi:anaerobic magnesium-protoporphyrin IX monomethyl ester cyclase
MRVLFVQPRDRSAFSTLEGGHRIAPGLLYVAEATRRQGHAVRVAATDAAHLQREMAGFAPDVIGVSSITCSYPAAVQICRAARGLSPRVLTVMGGVHVTFLPEQALSESGADYVIRGEGEDSFPWLLRAIEAGGDAAAVGGVCCRRGGGYVVNDITYAENLDELAYPSAALMPRGVVHRPFVYNSRGCPNRCSYCTIPKFYGGRHRLRSPELVLEEIAGLQKAGHKSFVFLDDNFTANTRRVGEICDRLLERGIRLKWGCQARVDMVAERPELVQKMARAGCASMTIGIESGVAEILNSYNKRITIDQVHEAVRVMESTSIVDFWYFMFGSADQYDTEPFWRANADFLFALDRDLVNISLLTPYPGTEIYERLRAQGRIVDLDWEHWDAAHCVYQPEGASAQRLEQIYTETIRRFYLKRPVLRNLRAILRAGRTGRYSARGLASFLLLVARESARRSRRRAQWPGGGRASRASDVLTTGGSRG